MSETTFFYDIAPYHRGFFTEAESLKALNPHLKRLIESAAGKTILDIGCGCGRNLFYAVKFGATVIGVDYSKASLDIIKQNLNAKNLTLYHGNNLALPIENEYGDLVISDGVIHHTGNTYKAFQECIRVLKPGGSMYLSVYTEKGYYQFLYKYIGGPLRLLNKTRVGNRIVENILVPIHYCLYRLKHRERDTLTLSMTRSSFYDYFLTPIATFQSKATVIEWIKENGCNVSFYEKKAFSHHFIIRKK